MFKEASITPALAGQDLMRLVLAHIGHLELTCSLKAPGTPCCSSADELSDAG